ncbi:hypothetical protein HOY82DRAFT_649156 [Tuber indicum]|nr:hypothetical protein HOY82DRAFT_649156 [Tuber indicum]
MVKQGENSEDVPVRLHHKIEKRSKARQEQKEAKKHRGSDRRKKNEGRRLKEGEQLRRRELAKPRKKELAGWDDRGVDAMQILEEGDEGSSGPHSDAMDEDDADVGTGGLVTAGTSSSSMALMPDISMSRQTFRQLESTWYRRYEDLEAKFHQRYKKVYQEIKEQSVEISRLAGLALGLETKRIKLEENFNLRGALERIAFHGRLIGKIKSHSTESVQAALDELAKTAKFKKLLAQEIAARRLVKKDVDRCVAVVYHEASKHAHGNCRMITIYQEDHTTNECAALATFLGVQGEWPDGLKWKEVKKKEQTRR